jgi:hypothetical protein
MSTVYVNGKPMMHACVGKSKLSHWDLIALLIQRGRGMSSIFSVPCVTSSIFKIDWLHTMDLGVAQDYLGNLFKLLVSCFVCFGFLFCL